MHFIVEKISRLSIDWNERAFDESDFYQLCKRFGITIDDSPMGVDGFHYRLLERDFIAIDSKLSGLQKLAVMFHELGHCLLHVPKTGPTANFHAVGHATRQEREADIFALCAIMPQGLIRVRTISDLTDAGYSLDMITARLAIFDRHKI